MIHKNKKEIKPVKTKQQSQKKLYLGLVLLLILAMFITIAVPVSYVPLLSNIASKFGLSASVARKLTLLDLALSSVGVETKNMQETFKKQEIVNEPQMFLSSIFEPQTERLLNAREMYYNEYEKTRRRPSEIAGIYQDGKEADTPEISGELKGVRALPSGDYLSSSQGFEDGSYYGADAGKSAVNKGRGTRRQARSSYDKQDKEQIVSKEALPDFVSSVYDTTSQAQSRTIDLNNSRIVKPVFSGSPFKVDKTESSVSKLIGASAFAKTFGSLRSFGGREVLGYYVADELPKGELFDFFGTSGQDAFNSYFYSHAAVGRKYRESAKHLSEIAFHGEEQQDKVLVAPSQTMDTVPTVDEGIAPITIMRTVQDNMAKCEQGRKEYEAATRNLRTQYANEKEKLKAISRGEKVNNLENVAEKGAPGSCKRCMDLGIGEVCWGKKTDDLRKLWNDTIDTIKSKCKDLEQAGRTYAATCNMDYVRDGNNDDCDSLEALKVKGGTEWFDIENLTICRRNVKWQNVYVSKTFRGCDSRSSCAQAQEDLFKAIDQNVHLEPRDNFIF